ncbi:MAG: helix-turn-helix transcriptional regulator [Candidatus Lokiarchaeota archaeon]|nr:helix-turn-helix transcriptional regulator [Candidatus Lokiarchaeota archaeon]
MLEITELTIYILEKVIHEIAPELFNVYNIREDESEEQQIKTGQLHENRILGIMLKFYFEGIKKVTTRDVELEYKKFYKDIARSTVSTYLNILKKEGTLSKERDGRLVYYIFFEDPPDNISPFWFTRLFCVDPAYFYRAIYFSSLYSIADIIIKKHMKKGNFDEIVDCFRYLTGIIILYILKNRSSKCILCQFGKQERYIDLLEAIDSSIKDRTDVLPSELQEILIKKYAEIPNFGGYHFEDNNKEIEMIENLISLANQYKKDMEFQTMVLNRRINTQASEKVKEENRQPSSF